jgi:hypothetical protein
MQAVPKTRPSENSARALELIAEARELLHRMDDPRAWLLDELPYVWDRIGTTRAPDPRWSVATDILGHDDVASSEDPLRYTAMRLLTQVGYGVEAMQSLRGEKSNRKDLQRRARELRASADQLFKIVDAVTAVHTLGEAAS